MLGPVLHAGPEAAPAPAAAPERKGTSINSILEENGRLAGVMVPSYDQDLNLTSVLRAKTVRLVGRDVYEAHGVTITFHRPDRSVKGTLEFETATVDQGANQSRRKAPGDESLETVDKAFRSARVAGATRLSLDRSVTTAAGMHCLFQDRCGLLYGPVTTVIKPKPTTAMKPPTAAMLIGAAIAAAPVSANPPPAPAVTPAPPPAADTLRQTLEQSAAATREALAYLDAAPPPPAPATSAPLPAAVTNPPGPEDTVIRCDGGTYFNSKDGILVYLGNVTVTSPEFDLSGVNELKIFFAKKDPKNPPAAGAKPDATAEPDGKSAPNLALAGDADGVDRIVATGVVRIKQKPKDPKDAGMAVEASGAVFTYDVKNKVITLSGGTPWITAGSDLVMRARRADQTITIYPDGRAESTFSPGGTENIVRQGIMNRKKDDKKSDR